MPRPSLEPTSWAELREWFEVTLERHHRRLTHDCHMVWSAPQPLKVEQQGSDQREQELQNLEMGEQLVSDQRAQVLQKLQKVEQLVSDQRELERQKLKDEPAEAQARVASGFCAWCFQPNAQIACGRCSVALYCSEEHLQMHSSLHAAACIPPRLKEVQDPAVQEVDDIDFKETEGTTECSEEFRDGPDGKKLQQICEELPALSELEELAFAVPGESMEVRHEIEDFEKKMVKNMQQTRRSVLNKLRHGSDNKWEDFIHGDLEMIMGVVVLLNVILMIAQAQWMGWKVQARLDNESGWDDPPHVAFAACEYVFLVVYCADVAFRIFVLRWRCYRTEEGAISYLNIMDIIIVVGSIIELVFLPLILGSAGVSSAGIVRIIKLLRLIKAFRAIRTVNVFWQLRLLLMATVKSAGALFWSVLLLVVLQLTCALILSQSLHSFLMDETQDLEAQIWVDRHYGDFLKAMYTMFEITYSGGWPNYARPVIEKVSGFYAIIFLFYVTGVVFAEIRVITALFLKETLTAAANDVEFAVSEKTRSLQAYRSKLEDLFHAADSSGDGRISEEEFMEVLSDPLAISFLAVMDLHVTDLHSIFGLLDDGDGKVTMHEFCGGINKLKGQARSLDIFILKEENQRLHQQCAEIATSLNQINSALGQPAKAALQSPF